MKPLMFVVALTLCISTGCSDAQLSQLGALGSAGHITCYSGGVEIYDAQSTGKIYTERGSDGWYFKESGSGDLIRVSGDCLIRN